MLINFQRYHFWVKRTPGLSLVKCRLEILLWPSRSQWRRLNQCTVRNSRNRGFQCQPGKRIVSIKCLFALWVRNRKLCRFIHITVFWVKVILWNSRSQMWWFKRPAFNYLYKISQPCPREQTHSWNFLFWRLPYLIAFHIKV